jgi:tRNA uridine 5-carbamoylmethylation protein Kti12
MHSGLSLLGRRRNVTHFTNTDNPVDFPKMKTAYILVGVPGSGKSTWVENIIRNDCMRFYCVISTDFYVEQYAESLGKTYSEVFEEYMPKAVKQMAEDVKFAKDCEFNIIWDQTSLTLASRRKKFRMLPDYKHIAVVVQTPELDVLRQRLASRPGKNIPWEVVEQMMDSFEMPTEEEGYSEVWIVSN